MDSNIDVAQGHKMPVPILFEMACHIIAPGFLEEALGLECIPPIPDEGFCPILIFVVMDAVEVVAVAGFHQVKENSGLSSRTFTRPALR